MRLRYNPPRVVSGVKVGIDGPSGVRHFFRSSNGFVSDVVPESDAKHFLSNSSEFVAVDPEPAVVYDLQHLDRAGLIAIGLRLGKKFHHKTSEAKMRDELAALLAEESADVNDAGSV